MSDRILIVEDDKMIAELEPEMERHIKRWGQPSSMSSWKNAVANTRRIVSGRTEVVKKQLKNYFNLSDERMRELFPEG